MTGKDADNQTRGLIEKMGTKLNEVAQHPLVKGALGIVGLFEPSAGAAGVALEIYAAINRRTQILTDTVIADLEKIDEEEKDREYIRTEEFIDLVLKTLEATQRTRSEERIKSFAAILCNSIVKQDRNKNDPESYLGVMASLSMPELRLMKIIWDQQRLPPPQGLDNLYQWAMDRGWKKLSDGLEGIDKGELPFLINRLEGMGLIMGFAGSWSVGSGPDDARVITPTGRKLFQYLEAHS